MSDLNSSSNNHIVSVDRFLSECAKEAVIRQNGQLVTAVLNKPSEDAGDGDGRQLVEDIPSSECKSR